MADDEKLGKVSRIEAVEYQKIEREWRRLEPGTALEGTYRLGHSASLKRKREELETLGISGTDPEFTLERTKEGVYVARIHNGHRVVQLTLVEMTGMLHGMGVGRLRKMTSQAVEILNGSQHQKVPVRAPTPDELEAWLRTQSQKMKTRPPGEPATESRSLQAPEAVETIITSPTMRNKLVNLAKFYLRDSQQDVDDLVQEALKKAWAAKDRFVVHSNRQTRLWIIRILQNTFRTMYQNRKNGQPDVEIADRLYGQPVPGTALPQEASMDIQDLDSALQTMRPEHSEAMALFLQGFSYSEIAAIQDVAEGTVKSRMNRARDELISRLEDQPKALSEFETAFQNAMRRTQ